jgi:hypothetical protein
MKRVHNFGAGPAALPLAVLQKAQAEFLDYASSSDNGTWNMTGFFKSVRIDIPDYKEQLSIVAEYERLEDYEKKLLRVQEHISQLFEKVVV